MTYRPAPASRGWWGQKTSKYSMFGGGGSGSGYRSLSGSLMEFEKERNSNEYDSDEAPSLVNSDEPMLPQSRSSPQRMKNYALRYHLPRRRFTTFFTLGTATFLILFIFFLVNSSWRSDAQIRLGLKKPPPPPPAWEQFPFLKRYHGGVRSLVMRKENEPEYPTGNEEEEIAKEAMERKKKEDRVGSKDKGFSKRDEGGGGNGGGDGDGDGDGNGRRKKMPKSIRFDPYANEDEKGFESKVKCYLDDKNKFDIPGLLAYEGIPKGFPNPVMGSYEMFGLQDNMCFERYGRLGPYGFGYSRKFGGSGAGMEGERQGSQEVWGDEESEVDYRRVRWAEVQSRCMKANEHRFRKPRKGLNHFSSAMSMGAQKRDADADADANGNGNRNSNANQDDSEPAEEPKGPNGKKLKPRTAILIRTWKGYEYDQEDMFYLRALVNELSLQSGTEYVIHFLIHVQNDTLQIWADEDTYQQALNEALPREFRGMGTLWSEKQMDLVYSGLRESWYRDRPVHGAYRSTYMPVQYFAHMHPEYDYFWHWEMDVRYTGHFHHLFDKVTKWAKQQPRKGLWERNSRFYVPSEHGSWEDFRHMVRVQSEQGTATKGSIYNKLAAEAGSRHPLDAASRKPTLPIWGPERPPVMFNDTRNNVTDPELDPQPPTTYERDNYEWGVGEEADFITFNPLFDPQHTNWLLAEDVTGYNTSEGFPPRRTAIITASRLSKRLLETMHRETTFQRHTMFSEMWPGSVALHHGYKAVYAPHPVYIDRRWPTSYLAAIFNNGLHGSAGGSRTSVFSDERQHNFLGTTWYYHAGFAPNLWRRWLGYRVDGDGGEAYEMRKESEGRICLPGMLLHPVKQVDLVFEHQEGDEGD